MEQAPIQEDSAGWLFFVHVAFALSLGLTALGIAVLPVDLWVRGYLGMGLAFTIGSTISLSKTLRDQHEGRRLIHRLKAAKTEKLLNDYELKT